MVEMSRALFVCRSNSVLVNVSEAAGGKLSGNARICHRPFEQPGRGEKERAALSQQTAAILQMAGKEKELLYVE